MGNEIVELVARAIEPHAFKAWQSTYDYCIRVGDDEATARRYADGADGDRVEKALTQARAAIAALREPSEAMIEAAIEEAGPVGCCCHTHRTMRDAITAYIDASLSTEGNEG